MARQTRGFRAPENCIKAVEAAVNLPFEQGVARERELFQELLHSPESKAQRYFFFAGVVVTERATPAWRSIVTKRSRNEARMAGSSSTVF